MLSGSWQSGQGPRVAVDASGAVFFLVDDAPPSVSTGLYRLVPGGVAVSIASGFSNAKGVAVGADGNAYVADTGAPAPWIALCALILLLTRAVQATTP